MNNQATELRQAALFWLAEPDAVRKAEGVRRLAESWRTGQSVLDRGAVYPPSSDKLETYVRLAVEYAASTLRGPYNLSVRRAAGFSEAELLALIK